MMWGANEHPTYLGIKEVEVGGIGKEEPPPLRENKNGRGGCTIADLATLHYTTLHYTQGTKHYRMILQIT